MTRLNRKFSSKLWIAGMTTYGIYQWVWAKKDYSPALGTLSLGWALMGIANQMDS